MSCGCSAVAHEHQHAMAAAVASSARRVRPSRHGVPLRSAAVTPPQPASPQRSHAGALRRLARTRRSPLASPATGTARDHPAWWPALSPRKPCQIGARCPSTRRRRRADPVLLGGAASARPAPDHALSASSSMTPSRALAERASTLVAPMLPCPWRAGRSPHASPPPARRRRSRADKRRRQRRADHAGSLADPAAPAPTGARASPRGANPAEALTNNTGQWLAELEPRRSGADVDARARDPTPIPRRVRRAGCAASVRGHCFPAATMSSPAARSPATPAKLRRTTRYPSGRRGAETRGARHPHRPAITFAQIAMITMGLVTPPWSGAFPRPSWRPCPSATPWSFA